ncbi:TonB-dependent receptor [Flavobacterium akiainvivens]|uniref:TonB-dependent receptor n=1 Tax=Flavobacterium akiainvivens TaxID=1202724 RepID=A0A0M8MGC7_9FLAO|nr:TonB-dependent receptor [Flavobacterium akiainvivens]KOS05691.1 TonB-dependent receptor [Flavobacterium akiainvivens]SFQ36740.1 iron complex outermembrane recepter protein [Flavobacterium akiainvivens]
MKQFYFSTLLLFSAALYAQTENDSITMNELIINENRFSTPLSKQNRNVYVIDKAEIEKLPARSLNEILQYANGVDIRQRGPFGSQADISIDGGSFEQTVVLINGAKIIDSQTAHNMLNLPIPAEIIERIEIIRGPAARVYGINSLTGAINIITKKPTDSGVLLSTYAGSNFEKDADNTNNTFYGSGLQLGGVLSKEKHQHSLFVSHDKSNGYRYNTGFENNKLFYQGNVQVNSNNEVSGSFGYIKNGFGANGFYAAPGDINSHEVVQTTFASVQSKHKLSDKWALTPRVSYRYNFDDYRYFGNGNLSSGRSLHYTNSVAAELNTSYKTSKGEFGFGAEGRNEDINSTSIGLHNRNNFGVYAEYRTTFFEKLNVNIGSYLNYNSDYNWQLYPGIDAGYALTDAFKIIGNIGTSQRIPSFTDLYLDQRPGNIGNPTLDSENAFQSELGFKYLKGSFSFNANYFYRNITNFIDWTRNVTTEPWQSQNFGDLVTNGLNMRSSYSTSLSAESNLTINLGYSYLDSEFKNIQLDVASKYLISSLKHQVTNTLNYQYNKFSVLFATRFNERATGATYWVNDFRISQKFNDFTVFVDAQNIFNTTYFEAGAIPLPARWCSAGVKFVTF